MYGLGGSFRVIWDVFARASACAVAWFVFCHARTTTEAADDLDLHLNPFLQLNVGGEDRSVRLVRCSCGSDGFNRFSGREAGARLDTVFLLEGGDAGATKAAQAKLRKTVRDEGCRDGLRNW
ncbi:hypothetical protein ACHAWF_009208 [Thalassiosira exigua]